MCRWIRSLDDRPSKYGQLPEATQETYDRFILGRGLSVDPFKDGKREGIPKCFGYASSKDVERIIAERRAAGQPISDERLRGILQDCGRDVRPIILGALNDPNVFNVLEIRAEWGDRSVKEQLEHVYRERLIVYSESGQEPPARGPSSLGELLKLAGTLACVSDGAEAQERLSFLMEKIIETTKSLGTGPMLGYDDRIMHPFWESLDKLPGTNAAILLRQYLRQTQFVDLFADLRSDMKKVAALLAESDRELAEEVVSVLDGLPDAAESADTPFPESEQQRTMRLTRYRDRNSPALLGAVFAHLGAESLPLLLEYLDSENEHLRAFVVWRLTSLGYEWSDEQLVSLQKDSFWKVRLNALFACGPDNLTMYLEDKSPIVRIVAQILIQTRR